jgi:hypothetical protein
MDPTDKYLPLARRIALQTEEERAKALRGIDPAIIKACSELMRIKFGLEDEEENPKEW